MAAGTAPRAASRELLIAAFALSGPVVLWRTGFDVPFLPAVAGIAASGAIASGAAATQLLRRLVPPVVVLLVVAAAGATMAGCWVAALLVVGDWAVRRRTLLGLRPPDPTALYPISLLVAAGALRLDVTATYHGPTPAILRAGLVLCAIAGYRAPWRDRWVAIAAATVVALPGAFHGWELDLTLVMAASLGSLGVFCVYGSVGGRSEQRWHPYQVAGPYVWAMPAAVWWMINVGYLTAGSLASDQHWYRAWKFSISHLPDDLVHLLSYTGSPTTIVAVLAIGAAVTASGWRSLRLLVNPLAAAVGTSVLLAAVWQIGWSPA